MTSSISEAFPPFPTLAIRPGAYVSIQKPAQKPVRQTGKIAEREIGEVLSDQLQRHAVGGKAELWTLRIFVYTCEKPFGLCVWVQNGTLSTANPFFYFGFVDDGVSKWYIERSSEGFAVWANRESQGDGAFPRLSGVRQPALGGTPMKVRTEELNINYNSPSAGSAGTRKRDSRDGLNE